MKLYQFNIFRHYVVKSSQDKSFGELKKNKDVSIDDLFESSSSLGTNAKSSLFGTSEAPPLESFDFAAYIKQENAASSASSKKMSLFD